MISNKSWSGGRRVIRIGVNNGGRVICSEHVVRGLRVIRIGVNSDGNIISSENVILSWT